MRDKPTEVEPTEPPLHCSFCRKSQKEIKSLFAGPDAYICNECIALCNDILGEPAPEPSEQPAHEGRSEDAQAVLTFGDGLYVLRALVLSFAPDASAILRQMQQAMTDLRQAHQASRIHWTPITDGDIDRIGRVASAIDRGDVAAAATLAEEHLVASFGPDWTRAFGSREHQT